MSAPVPISRLTANTGEVTSGAAVLSLTHRSVGALTNWAQGRGMVNPASVPGNTINAGSNASYFLRVKPRYQAIQRVWVFTLRCTSTTDVATVAVKVPYNAGSTTYTARVDISREVVTPFMVIENRSAQSATEEEISCNLAVSGKAVVVEQIAVWDMPRAALALDANDNGADLGTLAPGQRIVEGTGTSVGGVVDGTIAALTASRRVLMQWALPATTTEAIAINGTAYAAALPGTTIVLARKLYRGATTGTLTAEVYARTADTTDIGDVRFTMSSGGTGTINIPTGSHAAFAWHGAPLTFTADCEDLGTADGLQSSTFDTLTIDAKVTAAGDILYLAGISIWEA